MKLQKLSPVLWTKNLEETKAFYETVLGFNCRSNFPNFISLYNGEVEIMFTHPVEEPDHSPDFNTKEPFFPEPKLTGDLYIFTENIDELWELVKNKARIKSAIADRDYAMRDFSIFDNNGYELSFGEDISHKK